MLFIKNYKALQKIHVYDTPRLGGLVIFSALIMLYLAIDYNPLLRQILEHIFIFGGIILFGTLVEDIFHNTSPLYRFTICFVSIFLFFSLTNYSFPKIDLIFLSQFLQNHVFSLLFYSLATASVVNGFNIIDGTNGLCGSTAFMGFAGVLFMSTISGNFIFSSIAVMYMISILIFMFFNYPRGKIFLGDSGAYFLGFSLSVVVILFFGYEDSYSSWNAILILFYPIIETIFSVIRKTLINKKSPFKPDIDHLHLKVFLLLKDSGLIKHKVHNNNLVLPFLFIIWGTPFLIMPLIYMHTYLIITFIITMTIGYVVFYRWIPKSKK